MMDDATLTQLAALIEQGATAAEIAIALNVAERTARKLCVAAGLEPAPAPRGRPRVNPPPDVTIRLRVSAVIWREIAEQLEPEETPEDLATEAIRRELKRRRCDEAVREDDRRDCED